MTTTNVPVSGLNVPLTLKQLIEALKALGVVSVEWEFYWYDGEYHGDDTPVLTKDDGSSIYAWQVSAIGEDVREALLRLPDEFDDSGIYRLDVEKGRLYQIGDIWMPEPELEIQKWPEEQWNDVTPEEGSSYAGMQFRMKRGPYTGELFEVVDDRNGDMWSVRGVNTEILDPMGMPYGAHTRGLEEILSMGSTNYADLVRPPQEDSSYEHQTASA